MKISEKLSELKRKEGELMRLYSLRDAVIKKGFKEAVMLTGEEKADELEVKKADYLGKKRSRIEELNLKIEALKQEIIDGRNIVNQKNIEGGIDLKLVEMKFLRLELSKLMNAIKKDRYAYSVMEIDIDIWEELGIDQRIKELENKKAKLDAEIQSWNWNTKL